MTKKTYFMKKIMNYIKHILDNSVSTPKINSEIILQGHKNKI
jgi:hypothetical protein